MRRPYANNTLGALNDALMAPDLKVDALAPELERKARDLALRLVQESRWRSFESCLREARRTVQVPA